MSIFLSYSHSDAELKKRLEIILNSRGIEVLSDGGLVKGDPKWSIQLEQILLNADCIVVLWTKITHRSYWVRDEIKIVSSLGHPIVILMCGGKVSRLHISEQHLAITISIPFSIGDIDLLVAKLAELQTAQPAVSSNGFDFRSMLRDSQEAFEDLVAEDNVLKRSIVTPLLHNNRALGEIEWVKLLPAPLEAGQILTEANPT